MPFSNHVSDNIVDVLLAALKKQFEGEHGPRQHIRGCERGYVVYRPPASPVAECDDPYCEAARAALAALDKHEEGA